MATASLLKRVRRPKTVQMLANCEQDTSRMSRVRCIDGLCLHTTSWELHVCWRLCVPLDRQVSHDAAAFLAAQ